MVLQAIPLLTTPTTIITLLSPTVRETTRNPPLPTPHIHPLQLLQLTNPPQQIELESYLSRSLALTLLLLSLLTLLLTGSLPLTTSIAQTSLAPTTIASGVSTDPTDPTAPYAVPTLTLTLVYHGTVAFYCWTQYAKGLGIPYFLAACVSGLLVAVGGWCLLFATGEGRINRSKYLALTPSPLGLDAVKTNVYVLCVETGADKRTSGFPFKNKEADKKKAKI